MVNRIYGTWIDARTGLKHFASGVKRTSMLENRRGQWDTNLLCGPYIDKKPFVAANGVVDVVTCVRCLWKWLRPRSYMDILRDGVAGQVIIDEAHDFKADQLEALEALMKPTS